MQFLLKTISKTLLSVLLSLPWRQILGQLYLNEIFPLLQKKVADTTSKWDDAALSAVDKIARDLLNLPAVELQHSKQING